MKGWGWRIEGDRGMWRYGAGWMRPFAAAVPWITVAMLLLLVWMVGGTLTSATGVLFDLPDAGAGDGEATELVALAMPMPHETLVFFDDARFVLGDGSSAAALGERIAENAARARSKTMLVLADRRIAGGELMRLAAIAKKSGVKRMLFAEKGASAQE